MNGVINATGIAVSALALTGSQWSSPGGGIFYYYAGTVDFTFLRSSIS